MRVCSAAIPKAWLICILAIIQGQLSLLSDWPQFGGPGRNFQVPSSTVSDQEAIQPWRVQLNGGDDCPVIAGDRVIVSEVDFAADGTDAHRFGVSGEQRDVAWQMATGLGQIDP